MCTLDGSTMLTHALCMLIDVHDSMTQTCYRCQKMQMPCQKAHSYWRSMLI